MSITVSSGSNREYKSVSNGIHNAICTLIADLGEQETPFGVKRKVFLRFEVPGERTDDGEFPLSIGMTFTASLNTRSNLHKALVAWRGKQFTKEELAGFDLENVLGKPATIIVSKYVDKQGNERSYIENVTTYRGDPIKAEGDLVVYNLESTEAELEDAPNWIADAIRTARGDGDAENAEQQGAAQQASEEEQQDDIPF